MVELKKASILNSYFFFRVKLLFRTSREQPSLQLEAFFRVSTSSSLLFFSRFLSSSFSYVLTIAEANEELG